MDKKIDKYIGIRTGREALEYLIKNYEFKTILDIGSGLGAHSKIFKMCKKRVTEVDLGSSLYSKRRKDCSFIASNYLDIKFKKTFDAIWACHVLEHQLNPNSFLEKINQDLKEGGVLAITVPPLKKYIVGGHVTLWNAGVLLYQLVLAGFDCSNVRIKKYGYNISIILKKKKINLPDLTYDYGDVEKLSEYFPRGLGTKSKGTYKNCELEGFDGDIQEWNWKI